MALGSALVLLLKMMSAKHVHAEKQPSSILATTGKIEIFATVSNVRDHGLGHVSSEFCDMECAAGKYNLRRATVTMAWQ